MTLSRGLHARALRLKLKQKLWTLLYIYTTGVLQAHGRTKHHLKVGLGIKKPNVSIIWKFLEVSVLSTLQITYEGSLIQKVTKQYLSDIHWKEKATKCMMWMLNVSQDAETLFFLKTSFLHLTKFIPTAHSSTKTMCMMRHNLMMSEMS